MAPPLPLEVLQHIVVLTAEDGHVPPTMAPFYAQDPYWGTSRTYLSTPGSPCRSMPLICRDLRKAGEQALLSTIRVKGSTIEKLLLFLQAREGFGRFVKCAHIGSSEEPDDEEVELTSEGVQKLLALCPNLIEVVAQWLPEDVTRDLGKILTDANNRNRLQYLALSDNDSDFLPAFSRSSTYLIDLDRLWLGSVVLRKADLEPYFFGPQLRRLELSYIRIIESDPTVSYGGLQKLFLTTPLLTELVLVQYELDDVESRPIEQLFQNVIKALALQLKMLSIDGGAEPGTDWANYSPWFAAMQSAASKCVVLEDIHLRIILFDDLYALIGLSAPIISLVQCYVNEDRDWKLREDEDEDVLSTNMLRLRGGSGRQSATSCPRGTPMAARNSLGRGMTIEQKRERRKRCLPYGVTPPPDVKLGYHRWISYMNTRESEDQFEEEIFDGVWPSVEPWYVSLP